MSPAEYQQERKKRGSQLHVAELLDVHRVTIAKRESGLQTITREAWLALCSLPVPRKRKD